MIFFFIFRFKCQGCHEKGGSKKVENKYTAKRLPTTRLGNYIETRVNNFLRKKETDAGEVYIRVVYTGDKTVEVKPGMKRRYVFYCLNTIRKKGHFCLIYVFFHFRTDLLILKKCKITCHTELEPYLLLKKLTASTFVSLACMFKNMEVIVQRPTPDESTSLIWIQFTFSNQDTLERACITKSFWGIWNT